MRKLGSPGRGQRSKLGGQCFSPVESADGLRLSGEGEKEADLIITEEQKLTEFCNWLVRDGGVEAIEWRNRWVPFFSKSFHQSN